jgi:hypothetical protein
MPETLNLNLVKETLEHFQEGAKSVRAYTDINTYVITRVGDSPDEFWVAIEESPQLPKSKTTSLDSYFKDVFGVEARY